ncbi:carboxypeptidase B-like isoform X2 [Bradysia coprophila]|uniref:carboxypeptidase B-like isoform X2 n=1 Tax=Bradysia coprophila TaxID=38358 RepID=UPI00187DCB70|nr:carboxypeptidase B-like isoform X2 [Bradysia coprophila]
MSLKYLIIFVHLHLAVMHVCAEHKSYAGYKLYEVIPKTKTEQNYLHSLSQSTEEYDFWSMTRIIGDSSNVLVPPDHQDKFERSLQNNNITYTVVVDNVATLVQKERFLQSVSRAFSRSIKFNQYYRYDEIVEYLDDLAKSYPKLVTVGTIGKSFERRDIKSITISDGQRSNGTKSTILVDAGIHAREWIAPATALYIIHELVENYSKNQKLLENLNWIVVPVLNPDGYEYTHTQERFWRKTRKPTGACTGTDANRNFDYHWSEIGSSTYPCSDTFHGKKAFSEPETIALRDLMHSIRGECKFYLTLHSYGQYLLYPWGYTESLPATWKDIDDVAKAGAKAIRRATGSRYTVGSSTNVLYAAAGGSDDYALGVAHIPISITMELPSGGRIGINGFAPSPKQIEGIVKESWIGIKAMALVVDQKF